MQSGTGDGQAGLRSAGQAGGGDRRRLVLGIDTCGPSGSVALGRIDADGNVEILGQGELAGKSYSALLVPVVGELLEETRTSVALLDAIVVTSGPGSFTGVRVGLSTVKGLAEPGGVPVVAVSRLAVLAAKAGVRSAALDAHRSEVFLRVAEISGEAKELLAGRGELEALGGPEGPVAVCDEAAEGLLRDVWPAASVAKTEPPDAADLLKLAAGRVLAGDFDDVALLDGHYLRRSDAEIFGEKAAAAQAEKK